MHPQKWIRNLMKTYLECYIFSESREQCSFVLLAEIYDTVRDGTMLQLAEMLDRNNRTRSGGKINNFYNKRRVSELVVLEPPCLV